MKKKSVIATSALVLGLAVTGAAAAKAAETGGAQRPMNNLVSAIAQKFNLNASDVQQVFDEQRSRMEAQRTLAEASRLAQAVTDGKITQAQADLITAKRAELEAARASGTASLENATKEERAAAMQAQMESLKAWATANNIPLEYLMMPPGSRGHGGPQGFDHMKNPRSAQ